LSELPLLKCRKGQEVEAGERPFLKKKEEKKTKNLKFLSVPLRNGFLLRREKTYQLWISYKSRNTQFSPSKPIVSNSRSYVKFGSYSGAIQELGKTCG